jgi:excisionase family DNA binding protein
LQTRRKDGLDLVKVHHFTHVDILAPLAYSDRMAQLMQVRQAARALGVHENTIRRWEERGLLRAVRLPSGVRRFRAEDVRAMREQMFSGFAPLREDEDVVRVTRARSID